MENEMIITDRLYKEHFEGERDRITYSPYRVGDRIVRCSACHAVIKTVHIGSACPLCENAPFKPIPVFNTLRRKPESFLMFLLLFSLLSLLPFSGPRAAAFLLEHAFNMPLSTCLILAEGVGILSSVIFSRITVFRKYWRESAGGWLLLLMPGISPYLILAAVCFLIWFIPILFKIIIVFLIICIFICFLV